MTAFARSLFALSGLRWGSLVDRHQVRMLTPAGTTLANIGLKTMARVDEVHEPGGLGERLLEMGLTPGTPVQVVRRGMRGDPVEIEVRGYSLSLRRAQAATITVRPVHGALQAGHSGRTSMS
jgi:ferrous iron transport protein A